MADTKKHAGGRPLKFQSVDDLQKKIDQYFRSCDPHVKTITEWVQARDTSGSLKKDQNGLNYLIKVTHRVQTEQIPYAISALALALDTTRQTLLEYQGEVEGRGENSTEFAYTIKRAKERIAAFVEAQLHSTTPTGAIFNLKANYGWKDNDDAPPPPLNPLQFLSDVPTAPPAEPKPDEPTE
ncbi:MAG: terminase small subunit [Candidatus Saccharimonadales bacterium]